MAHAVVDVHLERTLMPLLQHCTPRLIILHNLVTLRMVSFTTGTVIFVACTRGLRKQPYGKKQMPAYALPPE